MGSPYCGFKDSVSIAIWVATCTYEDYIGMWGYGAIALCVETTHSKYFNT